MYLNFFSFSILKKLFHFLLDSTVFDEKASYYSYYYILKFMCSFSLTVLKTVSLILAIDNVTMICIGILFIYFTWVFLSFQTCEFIFFITFLKCSSIVPSNSPSVLFSCSCHLGSLNIHLIIFYIVLKFSETVVTFLFSLILFNFSFLMYKFG